MATVFTGVTIGGYRHSHKNDPPPPVAVQYKTPEESDPHVRFLMEGFDVIQSSYWQKASDGDLALLYQASIQKFASSTLSLGTTTDRASVAKFVSGGLSSVPDADRTKTVESILGAVLYNMAPIGRNQLLTSSARKDLQNEVNNVHPGTNLYDTLGVENGASAASVQQAYTEKKKELVASTSPVAKQELEKVTYAQQVLTATDTKANYDQSRVEPTVFAHLVNPTTLYVYFQKMSPTTESEFEDVVRKNVKGSVASMIIDLRSNEGGDLTTAQTFLGLFSGPNQYAFDFYHRGEYKAQRTMGLGAMAELKKIREIAVLTDGMTQSTAEVVTAAMKRLNLAASVGTVTRGWGSVEQITPMQTPIDEGGQHAMLLVVELTVSDNAQPIESHGVLPDVDTTQKNWQLELPKHFFSKDLIAAIKKQIAKPPQKI